MRMKKIILIAAVAIAAAACSKTFDTNLATEKAIGFGTWAENLTKARTTGNETGAFKVGDTFNVYGTKTKESTPYVVFSGDVVTAASDGATGFTWDYTIKRYWDPSATQYDFFAVLPAGTLSAEENEGDYAKTGLFKGSYTFPAPTAIEADILVADKKTVPAANFTQDVNLTFNHIASCVDLKVKQDKAMGTGVVVKVTSLSIEGIQNVGNYAVSGYSPFTVGWSNQSGNENYTVTLSSPVIANLETEYDPSTHAGTTTNLETAATLFANYVFMPQNLTTQKIKLSYTIQVGTEEPNVYKDVEVFLNTFQENDTNDNSATAITAWAPKTHYIYYLTIGADNVITFTATVAEWAVTTSNGYHYIFD